VAENDFYIELSKLIVDIRADTDALFQSFQNIGVQLSLAIPVAQMTPEQIHELIGPNGFDALLPLVPPDLPKAAPPPALAKGKGKATAVVGGNVAQPTTQEKLTARRDRVRTALTYLEASQTELQIQVSDAISAAVVSMYILPEKLSPIINSHLKALKREQDLALQRRCAESLALLMYRIRSRTPSPNPAILKQILGLLAADLTDLVPPQEEESQEGPSTGEMPPAPKRRKLDTSTASPETSVSLESRLGRRGAEELLRALSTLFGHQLFDFLPSLWNEIASVSAVSDSLTSILIIRALAPHLHSSLRAEKLVSTIPLLVTRISTCPAKGPVHFVAAKALATVVQATMPDSMTSIIQLLLPVLQDASNAVARVGAAIALREIVDALSIDILPFIIFLIIPILGRMSDQDDSVRRTVTFCFATLVKLLPLEAAIPNPPSMPEELVATRERERNFLMQLIGGGSKVDRFDLPIKINAQLRNYQQEGVNWLSFLNRYNLHGVLADDMGLGKTLQTLCVVASDDFHRRQKFLADPIKNAESKQLPSLVVCPPTLIGHWHHEVKAYCDPNVFKSLEYAGQPFERRGLIPSFGSYQLIITSYDIIRNDIEYLEKIAFNYCVLDEGHIIRNAKTKLTQAVKRVQANHRLILSGTPIQNSVLELWSLFDFLMPGFLGTEKQFTVQYVKPIVASRDAKASSHDQERGVLAMETLHRQVLPFVLRRLKEDVLQDLPPKIIQDVPIDLSPLQVRLYDLASATSADSGDDKDKGKSKHIFQALQYLRKLCSHPKLVLNQALPEYRTIMKELESQGLTLNDISVAPKLVALRDLLLECGIGTAGEQDGATPTINQHRVLIFCQLKQTIDIIEDDLFKKHMKTVTYMRLDGDVPQQQRVPLVEKFNSNPTIDVLMLTGRVGGLGLNLTGADTVIFMEHDWNPQADLQAMDRAHRLGAKKTVNVYRIITKGTLEDKIMSLQQFKLRIANAVVNKDNQSFANMDTSQLLDLFNYSGDASAKGTAKKGEKKASSAEDKVDAAMGAGIPKSLLTNLDELWDESQYAEEYNIDSFLSTLKK
jgi:TATA-binding protein-associated factor